MAKDEYDLSQPSVSYGIFTLVQTVYVNYNKEKAPASRSRRFCRGPQAFVRAIEAEKCFSSRVWV